MFCSWKYTSRIVKWLLGGACTRQWSVRKPQPSTGQGNQITQTYSDLPADTASQAHSLNSAFLAPTEAQALFMFLHHLYFSVPSLTHRQFCWAGVNIAWLLFEEREGRKKKRETLSIFRLWHSFWWSWTHFLVYWHLLLISWICKENSSKKFKKYCMSGRKALGIIWSPSQKQKLYFPATCLLVSISSAHSPGEVGLSRMWEAYQMVSVYLKDQIMLLHWM